MTNYRLYKKMMKQKQYITPILFVIVLTAVQLYFFINKKTIEDYSIAFIISSAIYFILAYLVFKYQIKRNHLLFLLLLLLIPKILFIPIEPTGSDDYYRYIWDGKVQANGINPFMYPPNSPELNFLHSDLLPDKVSYPHIKTIYFPVSQWLFTLSYWISGENAIGLKLILLLFEIIILACLYYLLDHFKIDLKYLLIYAALPLITFQFFIDAHIDLVGVALLVASITFYFYDKKFLSYILLGLSVSVKPTGLLLIPFYFQNQANIKEELKSFFIPITVFLITFLPYIFTATPLDTLINYSVNWTFNGLVYNSLSLFLSDNITIRLICGLLYVLVLGFLYLSKIDLIRKIYLSLFFLMLFSPVVHPWYLIWLAILLPVVRSYSGIYFVSAISLTFISVITFQTTGIWKEYPAVLLIEYVPLLLILYYEIRRKIFSNKLIANN